MTIRFTITDEMRKRPKRRIMPLSYAKLIRELVDGQSTRKDLVEATGLSMVTVNQILLSLRSEGIVRVCSRERDAKGRQSILVFEFAPDVPDARFYKDPNHVRAKRRRDRKKLGLLAHQALPMFFNPEIHHGAP